MGSDVFPDELRAAGVTPRELEIFWLVGDRLHNQEIADALHVSERTVESHVSALLRKLGGPDRRAAPNRRILVETAERLRALRDAAALPKPISSFVGRGREIDDLRRLVRENRLLTLTGPAGAGKTRLALRLANSVTALPPAVLVDFARVPPGQSVEREFADALGLVAGDGEGGGSRARIRAALAKGRHWLLVDNCEHVADGAAALLADLLATTRGLHVLATSHGPLRVAGEVVYEVPPLAVPEEGDDPAAVLSAASARLFADRAAAVSPGFEVTSDNARHVAVICRRLDGLPLAIELAAARTRAFSAAELRTRLDDRFAVLTDGPHGSPARHRTLEEALDWSYELLSGEERLLFERCSVFPSTFDYDTATRILGYPPLSSATLVQVFPRLLDRSLISRRRRDETTEYWLLDSVRQFAHRRLEASGTADVAREQHARHHLGQGVAALSDLCGRDQAAALRWFGHHWADLRAGMQWALQQPETTVAWEFLAGIGTGWEVLGARGELFDWLGTLLDEHPFPQGSLGVRAAITCAFLLDYQDTERARRFAEQAYERAGSASARDRALALLALGWTARAAAVEQGSEFEVLERAVSLFERLGDDWHRALTLFRLGLSVPDTSAALTRLADAADLFERLHNPVKRSNCLFHMANLAIEDRVRLDEAATWLAEAGRLAGTSGNEHERLHTELALARLDQAREDHTAAGPRFARLLSEFRQIGDLRCAARCLHGLGGAVASAGDHGPARRHLAEALEIAVGLGDRNVLVTSLLLLADADHAAGRSDRAAILLGAAENLAPRSPASPEPPLRAVLRERLGPAGFATALATGRSTPLTALPSL
ncbi:LuxR family transcriptional regulator [Actinomadura luteofluorescens]|uniref:ATP-binding protein n=1 Tax=Actinomadura luteofluorescens TaxID=46163 RepID=UPI0021641DAE|nr:LuxR C-terminal-related transcriptional regulator [Actinomadura glauciflava]MCR3743479.1 putative ATPase [Actinomadura glauciflava]